MDTVVLDDFVSDEFLYMVNQFFNELTWNYQNQANRNHFGNGTHRFFGANFYPYPDVVGDGFWDDQVKNKGWMSFLWEAVSSHLNITGKVQEIHANLQVQGQDGSWHKDSYSGDTIALIYFAVMRWRTEWGGCLNIKENINNSEEYNSYEYIPGRIIVFDGQKEHRGLGPTEPNKGRISLVYNIAKE